MTYTRIRFTLHDRTHAHPNPLRNAHDQKHTDEKAAVSNSQYTAAPKVRRTKISNIATAQTTPRNAESHGYENIAEPATASRPEEQTVHK